MLSDLKFKNNRTLVISIYTIFTVHFCGLIGMSIGYLDWFLQFTPYNLLLSTFLLFLNHSEFHPKLLVQFLVVFLLGFLVEVAGVATGAVFGAYHYGEVLGFKVMGVPLTIGMNWAALCFASAILVNDWLKNRGLKIIIGAAIPVVVDLFIERVCDTLDFWYWTEGVAPLQNYITWYICSLIFVAFFIHVLKGHKNPFAKYFLLVQFLFFLFLNLTLRS